MYVSHVAEDGRIEEVADHLREVAEMAAEFARPFGAESLGLCGRHGPRYRQVLRRIPEPHPP